MGQRISYILPTLNEEDALGKTLISIGAQKGDKEIIIADGGSTDSTREIARHHGAATLNCPPGRGPQMNAGASRSSGDILLFLHADTTLPDGASEEVQSLLASPRVIAGSFRLQFHPSSLILKGYSLCASINSSLFTYGDQGLFIRRSDFVALGGFKPYPILEDVDFQIRLRQSGTFAKSRLSVTTSSRRFAKQGPLRQQILNLFIVTSFHAGVSPQSLARFYSNRR